MNHQEAAEYAGAVADGELSLVPAAARRHIDSCPGCAREVAWQREVNAGLADALRAEARPAYAPLAEALPAATGFRRALRSPSPWSPVLLAGLAAAVMLLATAGVLSMGHRDGGSPVASTAEVAMTAAARAYGTAPTMGSSDPATVARWTSAHGMGERTPPALAGATLMGVRAGSAGTWSTVTYLYVAPAGVTEVTAVMTTSVGGWPMSETRMMNGRAVGVLGRAAPVMVVVAPDEATLSTTMSAIQ